MAIYLRITKQLLYVKFSYIQEPKGDIVVLSEGTRAEVCALGVGIYYLTFRFSVS